MRELKMIGKNRKVNDMISFRASGLDPAVLQHLDTDFIVKAINHYYMFKFNIKCYLKEIIKLNFGTIKHLLRQEGKRRNG